MLLTEILLFVGFIVTWCIISYDPNIPFTFRLFPLWLLLNFSCSKLFHFYLLHNNVEIIGKTIELISVLSHIFELRGINKTFIETPLPINILILRTRSWFRSVTIKMFNLMSVSTGFSNIIVSMYCFNSSKLFLLCFIQLFPFFPAFLSLPRRSWTDLYKFFFNAIKKEPFCLSVNLYYTCHVICQ